MIVPFRIVTKDEALVDVENGRLIEMLNVAKAEVAKKMFRGDCEAIRIWPFAARIEDWDYTLAYKVDSNVPGSCEVDGETSNAVLLHGRGCSCRSFPRRKEVEIGFEARFPASGINHSFSTSTPTSARSFVTQTTPHRH